MTLAPPEEPELPRCECGDLRDLRALAATALSGTDVAPCPVHRPERDDTVGVALALNADELTRALGIATTGEDLL